MWTAARRCSNLNRHCKPAGRTINGLNTKTLRRPLIGWRGIVAGTGRALSRDDCLGWAAELAFFWFRAFFRALMVAVAFVIAGPVLAGYLEEGLRLPKGLAILIGAELDAVIEHAAAGRGMPTPRAELGVHT